LTVARTSIRFITSPSQILYRTTPPTPQNKRPAAPPACFYPSRPRNNPPKDTDPPDRSRKQQTTHSGPPTTDCPLKSARGPLFLPFNSGPRVLITAQPPNGIKKQRKKKTDRNQGVDKEKNEKRNKLLIPFVRMEACLKLQKEKGKGVFQPLNTEPDEETFALERRRPSITRRAVTGGEGDGDDVGAKPPLYAPQVRRSGWRM
jgi:hypothetical protein